MAKDKAPPKGNKVVKLQIPAGRATPAPPVGSILGAAGIQIQEFCTQFNDQTKDMGGDIVPVVVTIKPDRSFTFIVKSTPASVLIKKAANVKSGSATSHVTKVGKISRKQLEEIAERKKDDLSAIDMEGAVKILAGTARSMGINVVN